MKKSLLLFAFIAIGLSANAQKPAPAAATAGTLTVTATTSTYGGAEGPSNYLAIWVVNSSGAFVNTLMAYYGNIHVSDLVSWSAATPSHYKADAITGATLTSHGDRTATWNGKNSTGVIPDDGTYKVIIEMTEDRGAGVKATYTFEKGAAASTGTAVTTQPPIKNVTISWTPSGTAVNEIKLENLYTVYPNVTKSWVFVNGPDIKSVEIITLSGKQILKSNQQKINLAGLQRGAYLAQIETGKGTFIKKIIKE